MFSYGKIPNRIANNEIPDVVRHSESRRSDAIRKNPRVIFADNCSAANLIKTVRQSDRR